MPRAGRTERLLLRFVLAVVRRPKFTLSLCLLALAGCVSLAYFRLDISTDQNKLFDADAPFFRHWLEFNRKFPENEAIYVVVQPLDPSNPPPVRRWTAAADAITQRLRGLTQYVRSVDSKVPVEQLGEQALLFERPQRLPQTEAEIREFVPLMKHFGEEPNVLTRLLGRTPTARLLSGLATQQPDRRTGRFVGLVAESWTATLDAPADLPPDRAMRLPDLAQLDDETPERLGYYYVPDNRDPTGRSHVLLVRVYHKTTYDSLTAISETVEAIRSATREAAAPFSDAFTVGLTGRPALEADEMRTTDTDTHRAEVVALSVVFVAMVLTLRSLWLALAGELALGVGIGWTFGWAELSVGELNLLSIVFLLALIGIGMDYLVQILTRYRREAARRRKPETIFVAVFRSVAAPINTACLGAAGAFLVSLTTDFQGAADLGIVAGGGLLLCLVAGYTVLPALLTLFPARIKPVERGQRHVERASAPARGARWLVTPVIWLALLLAAVAVFAPRVRFNPNLIELQAPALESVKLVRALETWSAAVLANDLDTLRRARDRLADAPAVAGTESILDAHDNYRRLRARESTVPTVRWTEPTSPTVDDLGSIASKAGALAARFDFIAKAPATTSETKAVLAGAAAALRAFAERLEGASGPSRRRAADRLAAWQRGFVGQLKEVLGQLKPAAPPDPSKLPHEMRGHYVSDDGTYALYVYPKDDLWEGRNLARFVAEVEAAAAEVPGRPTVTGIASNIHHSTRSIERSFYIATALSFGLIVLLVLLDLRRLGQTLLAVSVLALGLPMLVALMGLFAIDWNFANFFGLPILIGAAHEYGVFMIHRYREVRRDPRKAWRGWDVADRALLLCAFITSASFGFFWALGHHRGLRSLGWVMMAGCACIYLATVLVQRPILLWMLERTKSRRGS